MININYPKNLLYLLRKSKASFIPKKVPDKQKFMKLHHKYYNPDFVSDSYFKVIDFFRIEDENYIILSFSDNMFWCIPADTKVNNMYELIYDKNDILNSNIINTNISYSGYEIIYWFYNNYNSKYSNFKFYVEDNANCRVNESCNYFIYADFKNGKYTNIKIVLNRRDNV